MSNEINKGGGMPYKVVRKRKTMNNALMSCGIVNGSLMVRYDPEVWSEPPLFMSQLGYYLCYYSDFADAKSLWDQLRRETEEVEIWECEVEECINELPPRLIISSDDGDIIGWKVDNVEWPRGTKMAKRIKLVRKIVGKWG